MLNLLVQVFERRERSHCYTISLSLTGQNILVQPHVLFDVDVLFFSQFRLFLDVEIFKSYRSKEIDYRSVSCIYRDVEISYFNKNWSKERCPVVLSRHYVIGLSAIPFL
jgi:hypothetical protein